MKKQNEVDAEKQYHEELKELKLDIDSRNKNHSKVFLRALKTLETADEYGHCIVCGEKTYRDAAVVIRPGCWASPASFHKSDCVLLKVFNEFHDEIVKEETKIENLWNKIVRPIVSQNTRDDVKALLDHKKL